MNSLNDSLKATWHPKNLHSSYYDYEALAQSYELLHDFLIVNAKGKVSIDFSDFYSVKALNTALLKYYYNVKFWDIPDGFLCPTVPSRVDYLHHVADLLLDFGYKHKDTSEVQVLDIGVGASCIYPILGHSVYGWNFVGVDSNESSLVSASEVIAKNPHLKESIELRKQGSSTNIFKGVIAESDRFDVSICNPPFFTSLDEAQTKASRKKKGLEAKHKVENTQKSLLHGGGQNSELWCDGGEQQFLKTMVQESLLFKENCKWFTTLVSQKKNLQSLYHELDKAGCADRKTIIMKHGLKFSRYVAWTYNKEK